MHISAPPTEPEQSLVSRYKLVSLPVLTVSV